MTNLFRCAAMLAALLLAAACASTKDIEVASPDVINPVNRPMPNVMNKKPGG